MLLKIYKKKKKKKKYLTKKFCYLFNINIKITFNNGYLGSKIE